MRSPCSLSTQVCITPHPWIFHRQEQQQQQHSQIQYISPFETIKIINFTNEWPHISLYGCHISLLLTQNLNYQSFFIHHLIHKWIVLKTILRFTLKLTLKQLRYVQVQSHHHQVSTSNALPDDRVTAPKHIGAVLMLILT